MTSGDRVTVWAAFSLRQFRLLHQVTKELPILEPGVLQDAEIPETLGRHLLQLVRQGRSEIGDSQSVLIGFDDADGLEVHRPVSTQLDDGRLVIDSGTTTAGAAAWIRLARAVASTLGTTEFNLRTGGTTQAATETFARLSRPALSNDRRER